MSTVSYPSGLSTDPVSFPILENLSQKVADPSTNCCTKVQDVAAMRIELFRKRDIVNFVYTSPLFEYVENKDRAIARLWTVSKKGNTAKKMDELASLLKKGPMTIWHPLFSDSDWKDLVVLTHIAKRIDGHQLGTVFYWKSAMRRYGDRSLKELPLFLSNGSIHPEARRIMQETAKSLLTDQELDEWFLRMKDVPASEQQLLVGEVISDGAFALDKYTEFVDKDMPIEEFLPLYKLIFRAKNEESPTVMDAVAHVAQLHLFNLGTATYLLPNGSREVRACRIFPSTKMADVFYGMKGGHCRFVFRFGVGECLRDNGLNGERDIALYNPYQGHPERADGYVALLDLFTSHDLCYHAYIVSCIPEAHQKLFIEIGDLFVPKTRSSDPLAWFFARRCYDLECVPYRIDQRKRFPLCSDEDCFIQSLERFFITAAHLKCSTELQELYARKDLQETQKDQLVYGMLRNRRPFCKPSAFKKIIAHFESKEHRSPSEEVILEKLKKSLLLSPS